MPPTPIPNGFGIATIKYLRGGAATEDVITMGYDADNGQTADADAADIEAAWIAAFTAASTLNSYTFTGVHTLRNVGSGLEAGDKIVSVAGTVAAAAASPAIAVRVTKKTAFAGRAFRGRWYLPPAFVSEANVDDAGVIDAATITSVQGKCNAFLATMDAAVAPHAGHIFLLHANGDPPDRVTALRVRTTVGTQRRRQAIL